jgi:hypothetical protein
LRTLLFLLERYPQKWIEPLKNLLLKIKKKVEVTKEHKQTALSIRQRNPLHKTYDQLIVQGLRSNPAAPVWLRRGDYAGVQETSEVCHGWAVVNLRFNLRVCFFTHTPAYP